MNPLLTFYNHWFGTIARGEKRGHIIASHAKVIFLVVQAGKIKFS